MSYTITYEQMYQYIYFIENRILEIKRTYERSVNMYLSTIESKKKKRPNFAVDYGYTLENLEEEKIRLRIEQYELFLEYQELVKKNDFSYQIGLSKALICINPSYDSVKEELMKLKEGNK